MKTLAEQLFPYWSEGRWHLNGFIEEVRYFAGRFAEDKENECPETSTCFCEYMRFYSKTLRSKELFMEYPKECNEACSMCFYDFYNFDEDKFYEKLKEFKTIRGNVIK